jgi:hypothetical protein
MILTGRKKWVKVWESPEAAHHALRIKLFQECEAALEAYDSAKTKWLLNLLHDYDPDRIEEVDE